MSITAYHKVPPPKDAVFPSRDNGNHVCAFELRKHVVEGGAIQYKRQCTKCGVLKGSAIKHSELTQAEKDAAPDYDQTLRDRWYRLQSNIKQWQWQREHDEHTGAWWDWYMEYLNSPIWKEKRELVLRRAGGVCEACGQKSATQVHHLTYARIGHEPLFDLVAVCQGCHDDLTPEQDDD